MTTLRHSLPVVLFALLPCVALAAPGPVTHLVAPSGEVAMGVPITFSWQAVPESTWYLFWLGKGTPTALIMEQWYSADQAGCTSGGGTCTITLTPPVNGGSHTWFIQTWAAGVVGSWSPGMQFMVTASHWSSKLPDHRRFALVLDDEAVLDNETGLVWQRNLGVVRVQWRHAEGQCAQALAGGRSGWRVPTLAEVQSVLDRSRAGQVGLALPAGHPFIGGSVMNSEFWTATPVASAATAYYAVNVGGGGYAHVSSTSEVSVWCLRGPSAGGR